MVLVSRSIRINAPTERVFAFVSDPAARCEVAPDTRPIRVEIEGGGPLKVGSVCHFRLQAGARIVDYRTHVKEFEPPRHIVSVSDSAVPFTIRIETEPHDGGTCLTQTETFEPTEAILEKALPRTPANKALKLAYLMTLFLDPDWARSVRKQREEALARLLEPRLDQWLSAIKHRLEAR